jgi:hypothetical protein
MKVLLIPDASQSNAVINIVYNVGSKNEGYGEKGMAHLLEHMLFKSTKKLGDIKKMLSDKGGNANGTTWYDRTNYYEVFPSNEENLKWFLAMEADRMVNATILQTDLDILAGRMGISREETVQKLKDNYDGYHFTWPSPDIYNPFSLLNAFADGRLDSYWFGSGTPTYLIEMLKKYGVQPQQIGGRKAMAESFDAPTERMTDIAPLLYQSGYVTIKGYSSITQLYTLDIPNKEVRIGLMKSLLPGYLDRRTTDGLPSSMGCHANPSKPQSWPCVAGRASIRRKPKASANPSRNTASTSPNAPVRASSTR